jgi:hypothetical protein
MLNSLGNIARGILAPVEVALKPIEIAAKVVEEASKPVVDMADDFIKDMDGSLGGRKTNKR